MKERHFFPLFVLAALCMLACTPAAKQQPASSDKADSLERRHADWSRNAVIYEVNIRQYSEEGTFEAFERSLPRLKELGVDILWFMPVYPIGEKGRKGTLGSYYAVKDYKAVNPAFGDNYAFKQLIDTAHKMNFKVLLDWVANHTACDHAWVTEHPDWYVLDSAGNPVSPYDWTDTYELNYDNADMRGAMLDAMLYWLREFDVDGFRCDVAHEVPLDFWENARPALEAVKPVFMLAETEEKGYTDKAFDMNYSWQLLHLLEDVYKGKKDADTLATYIAQHNPDSGLYPADEYKMNFITNHDENSWNGTEYERYGAAVPAFAVLTYTIGGMPLIYTGQEAGMKKRLSFFEKDDARPWQKNDTYYFYQSLNKLKHTLPPLRAGKEGAPVVRHDTDRQSSVLAYSRQSNAKGVFVVLNLSVQPVKLQFTGSLPDGQFVDYFSGGAMSLASLNGLELEGWGMRLLVK